MAMRIGTRVIVTNIWDRDATDSALGRELGVGEEGEIVEVDVEDFDESDTFVVAFDKGGSCIMVRDEITRMGV